MQDYITFNGEKIPFTFVRRKRKTLGITVKPGGLVVVAAPNWVSRKSAMEFLSLKASWVYDKVSKMKLSSDEAPKREFVNGEKFLYLGDYIMLTVSAAKGIKKAQAYFEPGHVVVRLPDDLPEALYAKTVKGSVMKLFREHSTREINRLTHYYSAILGVKPVKITVKEQKRRWGSCTNDNKLNFNWKLIMAPQSVIEYVAVHELSHIKFKNHSKDFWNLVESILPHYKSSRNWLKSKGHLLYI